MITLLLLPIVFLLSHLGLTTSALRREYAPHCTDKKATYLNAYTALNACLKKWNYAPRAKDTGAFNCRKITGGTGWSLHAFGPGDFFTFWNGIRIRMSLAVDINWLLNPYGSTLITNMPIGMILDIEKIRTKSGAVVWRWGGRYSGKKDAMHFEIICSLRDLMSGIDWNTVPGIAELPKPPARPWKNILPGDTNAAVYARGGPDNAIFEVQLRLVVEGYNIGSTGADGIYGPATQRAVREFKKDQGWKSPDSVVGIKTINALRWWNSFKNEE